MLLCLMEKIWNRPFGSRGKIFKIIGKGRYEKDAKSKTQMGKQSPEFYHGIGDDSNYGSDIAGR